MSNINVREATKICFEHYLEFELSAENEKLVLTAIDKIDIFPIDKLNRWLGYIQGYVIFTKQTTIDKERDFSRPLFHEAYKTEGIDIPESIKVKID